MNSVSLSLKSSEFINVFLSLSATSLRLLLNILISIMIIIYGINNLSMIISIIIFTVILDYYDGIFFNKTTLNEIKYWRTNRRIFDSVIDRVIVNVGCIALTIADIRFLPFYAVIIFREVIISGFCTTWYRKGILIYPDKFAKVASAFIALSVVTFLILPSLAWFVTIIMFVFSIMAFSSYRKRLKEFSMNTSIYYSREELTEVF